MNKITKEQEKYFDNLKHIEKGYEFWYARELSVLLEYAEWRNFNKVLNRAKIACDNSGKKIADHFVEVNKIVKAGVASKSIDDYKLSRYACYLIVQNADPRKKIIALGQTYFAVQTYRQEINDKFDVLDEDTRRLIIRGDIKQWNQLLVDSAHDIGIIDNKEYAIFQNAGYMGLYGGLTVDDIKKRKKLKENEKILDFMGATELAANLFRISQTTEKLKKNKTISKNEKGEDVAKKVIGTARIIRNTLPNATYIGFTGTPISQKDRSTREVFGEYIDVYDMTQSVEDGATKPVYYESRVIKLKLDEKTLKLIDDQYALMASVADARVVEASKKELSKMEEILGNEKTVDSLVEDILSHYENNREHLLTGKALIVAYSRPIAMKIYKKILSLRPS